MILYNKNDSRFLWFVLVIFIGIISIGASSTPKTYKDPYTIHGKVTAITDGDTFKLLTNDSIVHRVRIASIDCPEKKQAYSKKAKEFSSNAIFGKNIRVTVQSKDRYGRLIARVHYQDSLVLNEELLKTGFAWHYVKYSKDANLQALEDEARQAKRGLWQDPLAIPPWEWRANKKKK
jgi:endonuclease YncB( thermonuclease family)